MPAYNALLPRFAEHDAQVVGISMDSPYCHIGWQEKSIGMLEYPLLSDFYPHGEVARKYDIFREGDPIAGINERAIFIVDKEGKIAWAKLYDLGEQPSNDELFEALKKVHAGAAV
jgi:peroxiredoxin